MHYPKRKCTMGEECKNVHYFNMKSVNSQAHYNSSVEIQFCPKIDRDGKVVAQSFPVFNNDSKIYTPAFCLGFEKNYSLKQDQLMLMDHIRKVKDSIQQKSQMYVPKYNNKNQHCNVCKQNYDDYRDHIESSGHKKAIRKSRFNICINQLCEIYKSQHPEKQQKQQTQNQQNQLHQQKPQLRKVRKIENNTEYSDLKLKPTNSNSTNMSNNLNQEQFMYNPFQINYNLFPNYQQFPMYCFQGSQMWNPMQMFGQNTNAIQYSFKPYGQQYMPYPNFNHFILNNHHY